MAVTVTQHCQDVKLTQSAKLQPGPLSLVEECRGLTLIGRELHSVEIFSWCCYKEPGMQNAPDVPLAGSLWHND